MGPPRTGQRRGEYLERTAAVGSYAKEYPHPWNLCDMHGNVYEHCDNLHARNGFGPGGAGRVAGERGGELPIGGQGRKPAGRPVP